MWGGEIVSSVLSCVQDEGWLDGARVDGSENSQKDNTNNKGEGPGR